MREFPSCFGEQGVQVADSFTGGSKGTQNVVTSFYRAKLAGTSRKIKVTWCKTLGGQGLSVSINDTSSECTCKVDMKPWLFWKKRGSKALEVGEHKVEVSWDLSSAKYIGTSPEPSEGFYLAVISGHEVVLLLGDMQQEALKRALFTSPPSHCDETSLISRREHIFGKTFYATKAQFGESGRFHDISIECQTAGKEPRLCVRVDKQLVVQVKRLMWKFRGNQTIMVDGFRVELLWDVHNWLFNPSDNHAVFMFQTGPPSSSPSNKHGHLAVKHGNPHSPSSHLQWYQQWESGKCAEKEEEGHGFSLLLYAWKSE